MQAVRPLWERPGLRLAAGDTLRPGGFALTDRAAEVMDMLPGWRVLDVGCGLGATVGRLRSRFGAEAYGVEPSAMQIGRGKGGQVIIQAMGDCLPFGDARFSAVFCECVLSLFPDPVAGLQEFYRLLEADGYLAVSDLFAEDEKIPEGASCGQRAVPFTRTRVMVEDAGFEVMLVEDHSRLLTDLAARLLFAGEDGQECGARRGLGYFLMIARKKGMTHVR